MVSPVDAVAMVPSLSFITDYGRPSLGRVLIAAVPRFSATMQPYHSPASFGLGSGSPRRLPTCPAPCSCPSRPCDRFGRTLESGLRVFMAPVLRLRRCRGLPGYWAVLRPRAEVIHPAGCVVAITLGQDSNAPGSAQFRGRYPSAHLLARLRCASSVAGQGARLTSGLPRSALAGRDLHPLDDYTGFHAIRVPSRPALPGPFSRGVNEIRRPASTFSWWISLCSRLFPILEGLR